MATAELALQLKGCPAWQWHTGDAAEVAETLKRYESLYCLLMAPDLANRNSLLRLVADESLQGQHDEAPDLPLEALCGKTAGEVRSEIAAIFHCFCDTNPMRIAGTFFESKETLLRHIRQRLGFDLSALPGDVTQLAERTFTYIGRVVEIMLERLPPHDAVTANFSDYRRQLMIAFAAIRRAVLTRDAVPTFPLVNVDLEAIARDESDPELRVFASNLSAILRAIATEEESPLLACVEEVPSLRKRPREEPGEGGGGDDLSGAVDGDGSREDDVEDSDWLPSASPTKRPRLEIQRPLPAPRQLGEMLRQSFLPLPGDCKRLPSTLEKPVRALHDAFRERWKPPADIQHQLLRQQQEEAAQYSAKWPVLIDGAPDECTAAVAGLERLKVLNAALLHLGDPVYAVGTALFSRENFDHHMRFDLGITNLQPLRLPSNGRYRRVHEFIYYYDFIRSALHPEDVAKDEFMNMIGRLETTRECFDYCRRHGLQLPLFLLQTVDIKRVAAIQVLTTLSRRARTLAFQIADILVATNHLPPGNNGFDSL